VLCFRLAQAPLSQENTMTPCEQYSLCCIDV
jgi:hypothetical protein